MGLSDEIGDMSHAVRRAPVAELAQHPRRSGRVEEGRGTDLDSVGAGQEEFHRMFA